MEEIYIILISGEARDETGHLRQKDRTRRGEKSGGWREWRRWGGGAYLFLAVVV